MLKNYSIIFLLSIFISSCGGGGSSTPATPDTSAVVNTIDEQSTLINSAKTVSLFATDTTYNQALVFDVTSSNALVSAAVSDSTLTLTPATDFVGTATISVKAYDGISYSAAKTFVFTVCASACAPSLNIVNRDATLINTAKNITLAGTDANSDSLTYSATSSTSNVVPSISGTTLTLTPATDWTGTATITAKASDAALDSTNKTFKFQVCATACLPTLASVSNQTTAEDTAKVVTLVGADPDSSSVSYSATSSTTNVTVTISGATLTLNPKLNWFGTATINAKVIDGDGLSATRTFTLTVSAVNDAPVVGTVADQSTNEDTAKTVTLSETDVEPGDSHTFIATSSNSSNVATSISGATLTLTPTANFNGNVTITIKANDGTADSPTKTFTLTVSAVNDAPVVGTVANQSTGEDNAKIIILSETDVDTGDSHTFSATSSTSNVVPSISGSTLTLTPAANWSGTATITIKANDGTEDSAAKTFTLTVSGTNDTPVLTSISNQTTAEDTAKTVTLSGTDVENDSLTYSATSSNSSNVATSISGTTLTLTPAANFNGNVIISAIVNDGTIDSPTKTFTLTVSAVNDAPVVGTVADQSTNEDTAKTVTLSETDVDTGDSHTFSATSSNSSNVATSISGTTLTLTPAANFNGNVTITIKANDGTADSPTKTFTLTVSAVNDAPTLASISTKTTNQSVKKTVTISAADADSDSLSYSITSSPSSKVSGSVSGSTLTLTPLASYNGTAAVTITVNDGTLTAARTFNLVVNANDPLYQYQWHLDNTGQTNFAANAGTSGHDINVAGAITSGYTGTGIIVAAVDQGLEIAHEDLAGNVVSGGSWDYVQSDNDPTLIAVEGDHGTMVSGLIASVGWNGKGGRGVAPGASLKGFNLIGNNIGTVANSVAAHGGASYSQDVDIFNQSYGSTPAHPIVANTTIAAQYVSASNNLRSNKGAIFVKSSGNGYNGGSIGDNFYVCSSFWSYTSGYSCNSSNADPNNSLPENILVGALQATGVKSSYSTAGSSVWVSAPGGEFGTTHPAMMTTDDSGCSRGAVRSGHTGNNAFDNVNHSENSSCNYTSAMNGTSSAAPITSGAIALMLEANPALTWRDVKHILATTSTQVDASKANISNTINGTTWVGVPAWTTNDAGHKFHDWYGFGRIDVSAAVTAALSYTAGSLGTLNITDYADNASGTLNTTITNNNAAGITNTIAVSESEIIEAVQIKVNIAHNHVGDVGIELVSPAGTRSVLITPYNFFYDSDNMINMILTSNAFYGEETDGNWTARFIDGSNKVANVTGTLTNWSIRFYEH